MTEICDFCGRIFLNLPAKAYPLEKEKRKRKEPKE